MTVNSNSAETARIDLLRSALDGESGEVFGVGFDEEATEGLLEVLRNLDDPPRVRLLAQESVLKWMRGDFLLASGAAELLAPTRSRCGRPTTRSRMF